MSLRPTCVLNVNDDDDARRYKSELLASAGFAVLEAARVADARRLIASEEPDVILLDVNLPDGNGVDLCRELRPAERGDVFEGDRPSAIVLISAFVTRPEDIAIGMAAGADAYLVEPLDDTYLIGLLRALAERHARRRAVALERAALRAERQELMQHVQLAQKMEAIGLLAGGIAHDFNNVLTSVVGFTDLIKHEVTDRPSVLSHATEIETAARRASDMVAHLLAFGRRQPMQPEVLDLNEVIEASTGMLDRLIGAHIRVERNLAPHLPTLRGDRAQIEQVILNLVVNARDAMPEGGRLLVTTSAVDAPRNARERQTLRRGRYVKLSVSDTGIGMDEPTRARIFEPFFTTKEPGRGTGLGLSTVYGIVTQSGGCVWVTSAPGEGTTFDVFFPALDLPVRAAPVTAEAPARAAKPGETVLVVEDEDSVRRLARQVLSRAGYAVLEAADGVEALEIVQTAGRRIDLLVTDLVLPGLSGMSLAQAFRCAHADGGVLYMTGYARDAGGTHEDAYESEALLLKPFSRDALLRAVRDAINRGAAPPPVALA